MRDLSNFQILPSSGFPMLFIKQKEVEFGVYFSIVNGAEPPKMEVSPLSHTKLKLDVAPVRNFLRMQIV